MHIFATPDRHDTADMVKHRLTSETQNIGHQTGSDFELPMSGRVGCVISESGIVTNMGINAETASHRSPALSIRKLFGTLSVLVADILSSNVGRCRPMSSLSYLSQTWSKMWG